MGLDLSAADKRQALHVFIVRTGLVLQAPDVDDAVFGARVELRAVVTLLDDDDLRVVRLVDCQVLQWLSGLILRIRNFPRSHVVVKRSADEDSVVVEHAEGGHDVPMRRHDRLHYLLAERLRRCQTHRNDTVVAAAHEEHVVGRLQGKDVLLLLDQLERPIAKMKYENKKSIEDYLRFRVPEVPYEHSTHTCAEDVLAIFRELDGANLALVPAQSGQARQRGHVPKMQALVALVASGDEE